MMMHKSEGQSITSQAALLDLLQLFLNKRSILVLYGIDEYMDNEYLVHPSLRISTTCSPRILMLSRINVPSLRRFVAADMQLQLSKQMDSEDIRLFCVHQFEDFIEEGILPVSAKSQKDMLVHRLVNGADGMFLCARLMTRFLRSSALTQAQRLKIVKETAFPEGLGEMYNQIFLFIIQSGRFSQNLAAKILI